MKVKDLIIILQTMDQEATVVHHGYEDGYNIINGDVLPREATVFKMKEDKHNWWNGEYDEIFDWDDFDIERYDKESPLKVVIL